MKDKCAIVGIGETDYMVDSGRNPLSLTLEAVKKAVNDAGLNLKDIDGIIKYTIDTSASDLSIATNLGLPNVTYTAEIPNFGGSGCATVAHAALAIAGGMAKNVLCFRTFTPEQITNLFRQSAAPESTRDATDFHRPFGWTASIDTFAMLCRRHMYEYGTTSQQLGAIAVACRKHASMNPRALRRTPITIEDHQNSPMLCEPLRELDQQLYPNDGACAVVVTSAERAKDLKQRPAYIMAAAQSSGPLTGSLWEAWVYRPVITESPAKYIAPILFRMAGITPKDIDVAELYDCYTYTVLVQLEDYGFCKKGEGGAFVEGGRIELGGELPINTHGGHLGESYIHGFTHILEGVRQIRGTSTAQVDGAELALVSSAVPSITSALILRR